MLSDPTTFTLSSVSTALARVGNTQNTGSYRSSDGVYSLLTQTGVTRNQRRRSSISLRKDVIAAQPLAPTMNGVFPVVISLSVTAPLAGVTAADVLALSQDFLTGVRASTDAILTKVVGGQI